MTDPIRPRTLGRVTQAYTSTYPQPLIVREGDELSVGEHDSRWPGFLWCANREGLGGWVPERFLDISGETGVMRCDYSAAELTVQVGDELILHKSESGWYWASDAHGQSGWIPMENVERIE